MKKRELYNILSSFEQEKSDKKNSLSDRILYAKLYADLFCIAARDGFIINDNTVSLTYDDEDFSLPLGMLTLPENCKSSDIQEINPIPVPVISSETDDTMQSNLSPALKSETTFDDLLNEPENIVTPGDIETSKESDETPENMDSFVGELSMQDFTENPQEMEEPENLNDPLKFLDIRRLHESDFTYSRMMLKIERVGCPKFDLVEAYIYPLIKAETDYNAPIAAYFYHNDHCYQTCSFDNEDKEVKSLELEVINTKIKVRGKYANGEFSANIQTTQPDIRITVMDAECHTGTAIGLTFIEPRPETDVYYYVFRKNTEKSEFNLIIYDGTWVDYETRNPVSITTLEGTKQLAVFLDEYNNIVAEVK